MKDNYIVDFSRSTKYYIYPTRFVMKIIFINIIVTTCLLFFLIVGDSYITYTNQHYCHIFPKEIKTLNPSPFLKKLKNI